MLRISGRLALRPLQAQKRGYTSTSLADIKRRWVSRRSYGQRSQLCV